MGNQEVIFDKIRQDSQWLERLMHSAKDLLSREGHLDILIEEVRCKTTERAREEDLLARAHATKEKLQQLHREVAEQRSLHNEKEERLKDELTKVRNEKAKLEVKMRAEFEYVRNWLDSRLCQEKLRADITQKRLTTELQRCRSREEQEHLITDKVNSCLRQSMEKCERDAGIWRERRKSETRSYELEIHRLRTEIEKKRKELEQLHEEYQTRQSFIDTCLAEKEAARRQRELEEHMRARAIKIQAWWRGVMVRRKLGPYRPEEKKRKRPAKPKK